MIHVALVAFKGRYSYEINRIKEIITPTLQCVIPPNILVQLWTLG